MNDLSKNRQATGPVKIHLNRHIHTFGPVLLISILTAVVATGVTSCMKIDRTPPNILSEPKAVPATSQTAATRPSISLEKLFEYKLKDYKDNLSRFDGSIKLQSFLVVVCVLLVIRRSDSLSVFGNQIPLRWLHVFIPLVMLYLWLNFGFIFDDLIDGRIRAVELAQNLSSSQYDATLFKSLFFDGGLIDGWMVTFVDEPANPVSGISHQFAPSTGGFLVLVLGTFIAATHASMLAIVTIGWRRYFGRQSRHALLGYYLAPIFPLTILFVSHIQFAVGGHHRNWLQIYVAFLAMPLLALLLWMSVIFDGRKSPRSLRCLMRKNRVLLFRTLVEPSTSADSPVVSRRRAVRVALIGDSLSTGFYVGPLPGMLFRMWLGWRSNWFIDISSARPGIDSVSKRLSRLMDVEATNHSSATARVDTAVRRTTLQKLTNTRHFSHQVSEVLADSFPDLLMIWIGHNNLDWASNADNQALPLSVTVKSFETSFETQLRRLITAKIERPSTIVVFGLVNFQAFFEARERAEFQRAEDPKRYPYLEVDYKYYRSMQHEFRGTMIKLAKICNARMEEICTKLRSEASVNKMTLIYSAALSLADLSKADCLRESDAWHPSLIGHGVLADCAYEGIEDFSNRLTSPTSNQTGEDDRK